MSTSSPVSGPDSESESITSSIQSAASSSYETDSDCQERPVKRSRRMESWRFYTASTDSYAGGESALIDGKSSVEEGQGVAGDKSVSNLGENGWNAGSSNSMLLQIDNESCAESDVNADRRDVMRDSIFGRDPAREREARRLWEVLHVLSMSCVSRENMDRLLNVDIIASKYSYHQLITYVKKRCGVDACFARMCPDGHMAATGPFSEAAECLVDGCRRKMGVDNRFWYSKISEQLRAMCMEEDSFQQIMQGCRNAKRAMQEETPSVLYDFYEGSSFRDMCGECIAQWNESREVFIFVTMSSDGFDVFPGTQFTHDNWPIIFNVLNLSPEHRFRAANSILSPFIPGTHSNDYFDTFLFPLVEDLEILLQGLDVPCADGVERKLRVFVLAYPADWPASTKMGGFVGHGGKYPCRYCHKRASRRHLIPVGGERVRRRAVAGEKGFLRWIKLECPRPRSNEHTAQLWEELDAENNGLVIYPGNSASAITQESGIKRRPLLSRLTADFTNAFPVDSMHLCLQGWVRHLLVLCCGLHDKTIALKSPFVINNTALDRINSSLENSVCGIPTSWGRVPPSLDRITEFKAETYKTFALHFGPILFAGNKLDRRIGDLWATTRDFLEIVFDATPNASDVEVLRRLVQKAHALFTDVFFVDSNHEFCFTPTTHAILHLADALQANGPLLNVSQFLAERVIGEIGKHAKSRVRPEANLFHTSQMLFGLRMLGGGLKNVIIDPGEKDQAEEIQSESSDEETSSGLSNVNGQFNSSEEPVSWWSLLGKGRSVGIGHLADDIDEVLRRHIKVSEHMMFDLTSIYSHARARFKNTALQFDVERFAGFSKRAKRNQGKGLIARQKCWITAEFESDGNSNGTVQGSGDARQIHDVYYGCVVDFLRVQGVLISSTAYESVEARTFELAVIDWQYGLHVDKRARTISSRLSGTKRGSVRQTLRTVELVECISRVIGTFDHCGRRFFLDPARKAMFNDKHLTLKGLCV